MSQSEVDHARDVQVMGQLRQALDEKEAYLKSEYRAYQKMLADYNKLAERCVEKEMRQKAPEFAGKVKFNQKNLKFNI